MATLYTMTSVKATIWRRAILSRALELQESPESVISQFWPYIRCRPETITQEEAKALVADFPFSQRRIFKIFSRSPLD